MKLNIFNQAICVGGLLLAMTLSSCEDFLTVYPTTQITQEDFWQDKTDLDNVRAGAYKKMLDLTPKIFYWGEIRSDNVKLKDQSNTELLYLQQAILRPSNNNFSWDDFYTGINYCNQVLQFGNEMTNEPLTDPSFTKADFRAYDAEMKALRALYYFYLVRAFRDVPYVTNVVTTDAEAKKLKLPVTSGEAILGDLINQLEEVKDFASINYGSNSENKGRFTRLSIRALLADLYLWRGCLLKNYSKKFDAAGHLRAVNIDDQIRYGVEGDTIGYVAADSTQIDDTYANNLATQCFNKAAERATDVIAYMDSVFRRDIQENRMAYNQRELNATNVYPLKQYPFTTGENVGDEVYSSIWVSKNSSESIMELQFDGDQNKPTVYADYTSYFSSSSLQAGKLVASDILTSGLSQAHPDNGFGKYDFRFLQNICYTNDFISASALPLTKNVITNYLVKKVEDVREAYGTQPNYRLSTSMNANWPVYRLADMMLIKAEAIARANATGQFTEANRLVNHLFARNNPAMQPSDTTSTSVQNTLLTKIYKERQREFLVEGKRWFDIVREAEAGNYYSEPGSLIEQMSSIVTVSNTVKNRVRTIWAFYNPILESEMKVQGVQAGGYLYQNPVWIRYGEK